MKLLLDTHTFLWAICDPARLPAAQRDQIESVANITQDPAFKQYDCRVI